MSQTSAQVNKLLTDVSLKTTIKSPIADLVLPTIKVKQSTGIIGEYGNGHLRAENDLMGGRAEARQVEEVERKTSQIYSVRDHGLRDLVTENDYDNVEEPFDAEIDSTDNLTSKILINKEIRVRDIMTSATLIPNSTGLAGNDQFSNAACQALDIIAAAQLAVLGRVGVKANAMALSETAFLYLRKNAQLLTALGYKYQRGGQLSYDEVKAALDLEYLFISSAVRNTAKQGQTDSLSQIWANNVTVYYRAENAAKRQTCLGYQFRKIGKEDRRVFRTPVDNPPESTQIIVKDDYGFEIVNGGAGHRLTNVF